jgi:proteasome lid subunit RPN8/RPN11
VRPPTDVAAPPVPIQEAVGEFVTALVDRAAAASKVQPTRIVKDDEEREDTWVVGVYHDQQGRLAALSLADLPFAAATGAALGMIPAAAAAEAVKEGALSETLLENYSEVANIMASVLNSPSSPHLKSVGAWTTDDEALPDEVWDVLADARKRREFAVTIDGYGNGRLSIVIR